MNIRGENTFRRGDKVNQLLILERAPDQNGNAYWKARCDCGRDVVLSHTALRYSATTCGHDRGNAHRKRVEPLAEPVVMRVFNTYQMSAQKKGHVWGLTFDEFHILIRQPCFYCGMEPSERTIYIGNGKKELTMNGIDRMDNREGYVLSNVMPCCKECNYAKKEMEYGAFLAMIRRIHGNIFGG